MVNEFQTNLELIDQSNCYNWLKRSKGWFGFVLLFMENGIKISVSDFDDSYIEFWKLL